MSSFKSRFSLAVAASSLVLGACATSAPTENDLVDLASEEQKVAVERADPLTRARFWAGEYEKEPENIETAKYFAKALRDIESHERVIQIASDTLILYPADYDMLMLLGRSYLSLGKAEPAAQAFGRAIQVDSTRAAAFAALGLSYDKAGQHQYAQRAYTRALAIEPNRTSTLTNYGLSQALSGNIDGAESALRRAASNSDADSRVRQNLALVLGLQGKFDEMTTVDSAAPEDVMKQNAEVLQRMIAQVIPAEPQAAPTKLSSLPEKIAEPAPKETRAAEPAPAELVDAAPKTPVVTAELPKSMPASGTPKTISRANRIEKRPDSKTQIAQVSEKTETSSEPTPPQKPEPVITADTKSDKIPFLRGSLD